MCELAKGFHKVRTQELKLKTSDIKKKEAKKQNKTKNLKQTWGNKSLKCMCQNVIIIIIITIILIFFTLILLLLLLLLLYLYRSQLNMHRKHQTLFANSTHLSQRVYFKRNLHTRNTILLPTMLLATFLLHSLQWLRSFLLLERSVSVFFAIK